MFSVDTQHAMNDMSWNFPGSGTLDREAFRLFDSRSLHWYPATYIPEIPYSLIDLLSSPGDKVLDPFAGTGTTLWQALALGREPFGSEVTLVGQNICGDIWALLASNSDLHDAEREVLAILRQWNGLDLTSSFLMTVRGQLLQPWFSNGTLIELAYVAAAEEMTTTSAAFKLLRLATSATLGAVTEQRRGWGCIADNMRPRPADVAAGPASRNAITRVIHKVKSITRTVELARSWNQERGVPGFSSESALTHLFQGDCVTSGALFEEGFYDLVVTSPPYPAMTDYSTAQRLSYYWHGVPPERDVPKEIGARRRRFSSKSLQHYTAELTVALEATARSLKRGGLLAMVVPEFASTNGLADARADALHAALDEGTSSLLDLKWQKDRLLPTKRRHINQKWTSLDRENIRVYERVR